MGFILYSCTSQPIELHRNPIIVYSGHFCASQPIGLHRNFIFWPTESHFLSICVISISESVKWSMRLSSMGGEEKAISRS